jgi:hypothetical protein
MMGIWTAIDPIKATIVPQVTMNVLICSSGSFGNTMNTIVYCFNAILILACLIWAELARRAVATINDQSGDFDRFNESTPITICIYTLSFSGILLVALSNLNFTTLETPYIIRSLIIFLSALPVMIVFIFPKLRKAISGEDEAGSGSKSNVNSPNKHNTNNNVLVQKSSIDAGNDSQTKSSGGLQFVSNPNRIRIFCLHKYADRPSLLHFTTWEMSDVVLDETGVFALMSRASAKKPQGKCFQIHKGDVTKIDFKCLDSNLFQIDCVIGINAWQFQSDSKAAMESLKSSLTALV